MLLTELMRLWQAILAIIDAVIELGSPKKAEC